MTPLSVEQYPNAAALAPAFVTEVSNWFNAGATPENAAKANADISGAFRDKTIADADKSYENNFGVTNVDPNSALGQYVGNQVTVHKETVDFYFLTAKLKNKQPYVRTEAVVAGSVVPLVENSQEITAKMMIVGADNNDPANNDVLKYTKGATIDTSPEAIQFTWKNIAGLWKLADVAYPQ